MRWWRRKPNFSPRGKRRRRNEFACVATWTCRNTKSCTIRSISMDLSLQLGLTCTCFAHVWSSSARSTDSPRKSAPPWLVVPTEDFEVLLRHRLFYLQRHCMNHQQTPWIVISGGRILILPDFNPVHQHVGFAMVPSYLSLELWRLRMCRIPLTGRPGLFETIWPWDGSLY